MKLYKLSILALALAGVFAACDDKDTYEPGAPSEGAYFSNQLASTVVLAEGQTTATIPVCRTGSQGAMTANVTSTDESGLFTIPASVTFADGSNTADLVVSVDASTIEVDTPYKVTLSLGNDQTTIYGNSTYTVTFMVKSPMVSTPGPNGTYYYNNVLSQVFGATDPGLSTVIEYSEKDPSKKTYTIRHWAGDVDLKIYVDESRQNEDGTYVCHIPMQNTGVLYDEGIYLFAADAYSVMGDDYEDYSFYNPETGLFELFMMYVYEEDGGLYGWNPVYEEFQLEGFPDYTVTIEYTGLFTSPKDVNYAIGTVNVGPDCDEAIVANISGTDADTAIQQMLDGSLETVTLGPGKAQEVRFMISEPGTYTLIAISRGAGEPQSIATAKYTVKGASGGDDYADWDLLGYAPYCDGWILPGFGVNPFDFAEDYYVAVMQHTKQPEWLRLVNPYVNEIFADVNENTEPADILINIADPDFCYVQPQYSGFSYSGVQWGTDWYIGDVAGLYMAMGATVEEAMETLIANDFVPTAIVDGILTVDLPLFGGSTADTFGYNWNEIYPVEIYLSEMVSADQAPVRNKAPKRMRLGNVMPQLAKSVHGSRSILTPSRPVELIKVSQNGSRR